MTGRAGKELGEAGAPQLAGLSRVPAPSPCGESGPRSLADEGAAAERAQGRGTSSPVSTGPPHCRHLGPPFFAARRGRRPPSPTRLAQAGPSAPAVSPTEPRAAIGDGAVMDGGSSQWPCSPAARALSGGCGSSVGRGGRAMGPGCGSVPPRLIAFSSSPGQLNFCPSHCCALAQMAGCYWSSLRDTSLEELQPVADS